MGSSGWLEPSSDPRVVLDLAVEDGVMSGAVLQVRDLARRTNLLSAAAGRVSTEPRGPRVRETTRFDLASLTKVYTAVLCAELVADGTLDAEAPIASLLGTRARPWHDTITLRDLLDHRAGLPAWAALWTLGDPEDQALLVPPERAPGASELYSDLGFLTIRAALQGATGLPLGVLVDKRLLLPWGLRDTGYRGTEGEPELRRDLLRAAQFAATERDPERGLLVGEVHDENTWHLGGVSTHAGLFASAGDVAAFAQGVWDLGLGQPWWDAPRVGGSHTFGWDSPSGPTSSVGVVLSRRCRGHLGFTGTSLWIDPDRAISVVLLTNRVHPSRRDERIRVLRPLLHDAVARFLDEEGMGTVRPPERHDEH